MEKLSDFFYELRDRTTNPLFVSFIIAWLVYNWKIPLVLIFYKQSELQIEGYKTYAQFISANLQLWNSLLTPLIYAFAYIILMPPLRALIFAFFTLIKTKSNDWNLEISKTGSIPTTHFIKLRQKYIDQTEMVKNVVTSESATVVQLADLQAEMNKVNHEFSIKKTENIYLNNTLKLRDEYADVSILNGDWEYRYSPGEGANGVTVTYHFENGEVFAFSNPDGAKVKEYDIKNFCFNHITKQFMFIRIPKHSSSIEFHCVNYDPELIKLEGKDQRNGHITYTKINNLD